MNLGQFLTAKSPLPSGTVAQHLAAIAASSGSGAGRVVYCSQVTTIAETTDLSVMRKPKRTQQVAEQVPAERSVSRKKNDIFSKMTSSKNIVVLFEADEITVTKRISQISTVRRAADGL